MAEFNAKVIETIDKTINKIILFTEALLINLWELYYLGQIYFLIFFVFMFIFLYRRLSKEATILKRNDIVEVISHLLFSLLIGFVLKRSAVSEILTEYITLSNMACAIAIFILIVYLKRILIYTRSRGKINHHMFKYIYILLLVYIVASYIVGSTYNLFDVIMLTILLLTIVLLSNYTVNNFNKDIKDDVSKEIEFDEPIKSYDKLLPTRKTEFKRIHSYLSNYSYNEPFAITINADWGEGKTSFINTLIDKFKEEDHNIMTIQPMVLDDTEKIMKYFFGELEYWLKSNGIYTGIGSPLTEYFKLVMNILNVKSISNLSRLVKGIQKDSNEDNSDFREKKKALEKDIQGILSEKQNKFFVIIDDLDRVEEHTLYDTIVFIKEIVNFKGIKVLFLMDHRKFDGEKINSKYLDKFVNKRFDLSKIDYKELFDYFIEDLDFEFKTDLMKNEMENLKAGLVEYIEEFIDHVNVSIDGEEKEIEGLERKSISDMSIESRQKFELLDENIKYLKDSLNNFEINISNIRKVKMFLREIKEIFTLYDNILLEEGKNSKFRDKNLKKIQMNKLIFKLATFKVILDSNYYSVFEQRNIEVYLQDSHDTFLKILFNEIVKSESYAEDIIIRKHKIEFYNRLLFSIEEFGLLNTEMLTENEELLKEIDNYQNIAIVNQDIETIRRYVASLKYSYYQAPRELYNKRVYKLSDLIILLLEKERLSLDNVFQLLETVRDNPLLDNKVLLEKINRFLKGSSNLVFDKPSQKHQSIRLINEIDREILLKYQEDIIQLVELIESDGDKESEIRIDDNFEKLLSIEEFLKAILPNVLTKLTGLEHFELWVKDRVHLLKQRFSKNNYMLDAIKACEENLSEFIGFIYTVDKTEQLIKCIPTVNKKKFEAKIDAKNFKELENGIIELYESIGTSEFSDLNAYRYFYIILRGAINHVDQINNDLYEKITLIYREMSKDIDKDIRSENRIWILCTFMMGEIKEYLKLPKID